MKGVLSRGVFAKTHKESKCHCPVTLKRIVSQVSETALVPLCVICRFLLFRVVVNGGANSRCGRHGDAVVSTVRHPKTAHITVGLSEFRYSKTI